MKSSLYCIMNNDSTAIAYSLHNSLKRSFIKSFYLWSMERRIIQSTYQKLVLEILNNIVLQAINFQNGRFYDMGMQCLL